MAWTQNHLHRIRGEIERPEVWPVPFDYSKPFFREAWWCLCGSPLQGGSAFSTPARISASTGHRWRRDHMHVMAWSRGMAMWWLSSS